MLKRLLHFFTYHPWLKIVSLILAVLTWLYIFSEIKKLNY